MGETQMKIMVSDMMISVVTKSTSHRLVQLFLNPMLSVGNFPNLDSLKEMMIRTRMTKTTKTKTIKTKMKTEVTTRIRTKTKTKTKMRTEVAMRKNVKRIQKRSFSLNTIKRRTRYY